MQTKLFVRNLPFSASESDLQQLFQEQGDVLSAKIPTDRDTGRARGFGFVEMSDQAGAESAIRNLEGRDFQGRQIHVSFSEPREKRPNTAYGGGNRSY